MPSITVPAAVVAAATVGGSVIQGQAAKSAAKTQAGAADRAAQMQYDMFQQIRGDLGPYMVTGNNALNSLSMLTGNSPSNSAQIAQLTQQLNAAKSALAALPAGGTTNSTGAPGSLGLMGAVLGGSAGAAAGNALAPNGSPVAAAGSAAGGQLPGDRAGLESLISNLQNQINEAQYSSTPGNPLTAPLTRPFQPTMQELENTPGYQFTLNQGLRAAQNAATSMGLGQSGPAIAGAADYASGLASQTYQQQFQNYWANNMNLFSMLFNQAQLGQASAAGAASAGLGTAQAASNALLGGANATAAGKIGAANAAAGGLGQIGSLAMLYGMQNNNLFGSPSPPAVATLGSNGWYTTGPGGFPEADTGGF